MSDGYKIIQQVYQAKKDVDASDQLILNYMPFIKSETAKFLKRAPEKNDDELSIAMIAFHEAIINYSFTRGAFLKYAAMTIKSRLMDYYFKERRHSHVISLDLPIGKEEDTTLLDTLDDGKNHSHELILRDATRTEIEELTSQMREFGVSLEDVAENCPKQQRTLIACKQVLQYAKENPQLLDEFLQTKRLPMAQLTAGSQVDRKTIERHRKYIVALLLIRTNGYEIIRGHLKQIMKGVTA